MPRDPSCRRLPPPSAYPKAEKQRPAAPLLLLLLASWAAGCQGVPVSPLAIQTDKELQLWNELDNACSGFLSVDPQPQVSSELEDLCYMIMGILPKAQESDEKDNTKRFLFHYSKTHNLGNSDIMSSIVHPLLQLVPQLHERRMKRFKVDSQIMCPTVDDQNNGTWNVLSQMGHKQAFGMDSLNFYISRRIPRTRKNSKSGLLFIQASEWKKVNKFSIKGL